jgi:hypothetical protein
MTNNEFPPLEPEKDLTEVFPEIPEQMEPLEDLPVVEDLPFEQEIAEQEVLEEPIIDEIPVIPETDPVEELSVLEETVQPEEPEIPEISSVSAPTSVDTALVTDPSAEVEQMEVSGENWEVTEDFPMEISAAEPECSDSEEETIDQKYLIHDQSFDSMMNPPETQP